MEKDKEKQDPVEQEEKETRQETDEPQEQETQGDIKDMEYSEENFAELQKLAKVSAEALLRESKRCTELEQRQEALQTRTDELHDGMMRLQAEFDNYRKRTQAEIDALFADGMAEALRTMLPVMDNLERARDAANESDENIGRGISMCIDQFMDAFGKQGLSEIEAEGQEFDPNLHEAIMQQPCEEDGQSGKVAEVLQRGYMFKDKVLRYSVVKVYE